MKILNLEQFLAVRGLNYKAVIGPRWKEKDSKGKPSEDRFYIINSELDTKKTIRSVWKKGDWAPGIVKAMNEFDIHETKMMYSDDLDSVKRTILAEGEKAYSAYVIRQKRIDSDSEVEVEDNSKKFEKILKGLK